MSRRIIVSDLHADTWTGAKGRTKLNHFRRFLNRCKEAKIAEFIINGDLMDMPPYDGQFAFPGDDCIARTVIEELALFGCEVPVTFVFGNHDIGVSGFRSLGQNNISMLRNASFCYPDYRVDYVGADGKLITTILVEHGHFYDPALVLYLRDLAERTYIESKFEAFQWVMQRRDVHDPSRIGSLGAQAPVDVKHGENAFEAMERSASPEEATRSGIVNAMKELGLELVEKYKLGKWRDAAADEMRQHVEKTAKAREPIPPLVQLVFGHTHRTDRVKDIDLGHGAKGIYFNAGSWTQHSKPDTNQAPYLDVREDGIIWLQDWIKEPEELKRL